MVKFCCVQDGERWCEEWCLSRYRARLHELLDKGVAIYWMVRLY